MKIKLFILFFNLVFLSEKASFSQPAITEISINDLENPGFYKNCDPFELKSAFFRYLHLANKLVLLKEEKKAISFLSSSPETSYKMGEIDKLECLKLETIFTDLISEINKTSYDVSIAENDLKQILRKDINIVTVPDTLFKYISFDVNDFIKFQMSSLPDTLSDNFAGFIERENKMLELQKKEDILNYYKSTKIPLSIKIKNDALLLLQLEEAGIYEYANMICSSYDTMVEYYNVLNEYNQLSIQTEKYYEDFKNH